MSKKTVLITGASSGIGIATALHFHEKGWNVAATMRSPEKANLPSGILTPRLDVTDPVSVQSAWQETLGAFSEVDVVVNNAGYGLVGPFEAIAPTQIQRQFQTNVFGLMNVVREVLPRFRQRRSGTIINIASMGGRITFPLYSLYHGTKWAVEGFSESLQYELAPFNVRVKVVEPGPIKTDFYERSMDLGHHPEYESFVAKAMPNMQKAGQTAPGPEAVAKVIYRAATDGSNRLRYTANSAAILGLRKLLPDSMFFNVVRATVLK